MNSSCSKNDNKSSPPAINKIFYGNIVIDGQENLEKFGRNNFNIIDGNILIHPNRIVDFTPLVSLQEVLGSLTIYPSPDSGDINRVIKNLDGLQNLEFVRGNLEIWFLDSISDMNGLENLKKVGKSLYVVFCDGLVSLAGLDNLREIGEDTLTVPNELALVITENQNLKNFCALKNTQFRGKYAVTDNAYNPSKEELKNGNCSW